MQYAPRPSLADCSPLPPLLVHLTRPREAVHRFRSTQPALDDWCEFRQTPLGRPVRVLGGNDDARGHGPDAQSTRRRPMANAMSVPKVLLPRLEQTGRLISLRRSQLRSCRHTASSPGGIGLPKAPPSLRHIDLDQAVDDVLAPAGPRPVVHRLLDVGRRPPRGGGPDLARLPATQPADRVQ
jgi:hypothetical protein